MCIAQILDQAGPVMLTVALILRPSFIALWNQASRRASHDCAVTAHYDVLRRWPETCGSACCPAPPQNLLEPGKKVDITYLAAASYKRSNKTADEASWSLVQSFKGCQPSCLPGVPVA